MSKPKQIYKRAFLTEREREKRVQNCPTQVLDIYLRCLTWKLAGYLKSEARSGRHHSGSVDYARSLYSEHLSPRTARTKLSS